MIYVMLGIKVEVGDV